MGVQVVFLLFSIPTVLDNRSAFSARRFFDLFRSISNRSLNKNIDWLLLQIFGVAVHRAMPQTSSSHSGAGSPALILITGL